MREHIERHKAIEAIKKYPVWVKYTEGDSRIDEDEFVNDIIKQTKKAIISCVQFDVPSSEEESFEWCPDCKEYDQEKLCCHRWTKVIRNTVEELRVVKCEDCKYAEYMDDVQSLWCTESGNGRTVAPYDFCSYGERRTDG